MNKTNIIVGILAGAALVLGITNFGKPINVAVSPTPVQVNMPEQKTPIVNVAAPEVTVQAPNVNIPATVVNVPESKQALGAVSGPDNYFPYWAVNGVRKHYFSSGFNNASTTLCSFKTPAATTTLEFASLKIRTATSTAIVVDIGKGSIYNATTTLFGTTYTVVAGEQDTIIASTSPAAGAKTVIAPSQWVNFKFGSSAITPTVNSLAGSCKAVLVEN